MLYVNQEPTGVTHGRAMANEPDISVVIPAYNEAESIEECVCEVVSVLGQLGQSHEVVVVDDGSTDGTFAVLRSLRAQFPQLRALRFRKNAGQTAAMAAGFERARGDVVVTMDADLQNDPADIPRLLDALGEFDVVCGIREKRHDTFVRRISSRIANGVRNWLTHESIRDVGCSLRAMKREFLAELKLYDGMHRFLPTLLKLEGATVIEIPVNHRRRRRGRTKYGIRNRLFRGLRDLFAVRWMQRRWIRYEVEEEL